MELIPERFIEPLQWFSDFLKGNLKPEAAEDGQVVQRGLLLFRQGSVLQLKLEKDEYVTGVVQDVTPVKIKLDLKLPYLSECSCPGEGICRHQMAAFFQLLSHHHSVSVWVEEWRQPLHEQKQAKSLGLIRARDLLKSTGQGTPSYENWTTSIRESFDVIMKANGTPKPYLINDLFSVYERRITMDAPLAKDWKVLYELIAGVISFQKLLELSIELQHEERTINHHYRHLFQNMLDDLEQITDKFSVQSLPFAFDEFIDKLRHETAILLTVDASFDYERVHLFRILWSNLFKKRNWREEMTAHLSKHPSSRFSIMVGSIHLYLLLGNDEKARDIVISCGADITPYFFYWFDILDTKQKEFYIVHFIGVIKDYLKGQNDYFAARQFMYKALKIIKPYCTEHERPELMERAYVNLLPHSSHDYQHFLLENKEYNKWMELQTYIGFSLETVSKESLKTLQIEAPQVLLPLYHQAIQADLAGKNRVHYRQAVRKLKKLRTLYRKLKRLDEWEEYFDILLSRTKRMRAFQEECKRGKLIDA